MHHPKPGTAEYEEHVQEEIEQFSAFFTDGEGRETLQQPIPLAWQEVERRAAMVILEKTGAFLNGHIEKRLNARPGTRPLSLGSGPGGMEIEYAKQVVATYEEAEARGEASVTLNGKMIDIPIVERARTLLAMAEKVAASR